MYLAFGYWMCSNKQLLSNDYLKPVETTESTLISSHTIMSVFSAEGWTAPSWPFLLFFWIYVFYIAIPTKFKKQYFEIYFGKNIEISDLDEDLDNYWASLDENDRKWSIGEEKNNRKILSGFKTLTDYQFYRL
jgi:hypothetical protein